MNSNKIRIDHLSNTSKTIINDYMIRKSRKQKDAFYSYLETQIKDMPIVYENYGNSNYSKNIIVGDVNKAKYIYTAHYDTCATMFIFPNFITPKNIFIFFLYQVLLTFIMLFLSLIIPFILFVTLDNWSLAYISWLILLVLLIYQMMLGYRNKNNYNDNTSGVITLVEMIKKLPEESRDKFCFVFFDNEEKGLLGSGKFKKKYKDILNEKVIINFDCVSDGNNILFVYKNLSDGMIDFIQNNFNSENKKLLLSKSSNAIYPSDQKNFKNNIGIVALNKNAIVGYYMSRIHTFRDVVFDEDNIFILRDLFIKLTIEC